MESEIIKNQLGNILINNYDSSYARQYKLNGLYMLTHVKYCAEKDLLSYTYMTPGSSETEYFRQTDASIPPIPIHQHDYYELLYVISGSVTHCIEQEQYSVHPGDACLLNHHVRHYEKLQEDADVFFLALSDELFRQIIRFDVRFDENGHISSNSNPIYDLMIQSYQKEKFQKSYWDFQSLLSADKVVTIFQDMFFQLITENDGRRPGFLLIIQGIIARILSSLQDPAYYSYTQYVLPSHIDEYLFYCIQDIMEETHGNISRGELSQRLSYSPDHLNKITQKYAGKSLLHFGRIFTLKEAARLLTQTDLSVIQILNQLGFSNSTYFYKIFQNQYGMSPKDYRAKQERSKNKM